MSIEKETPREEALRKSDERKAKEERRRKQGHSDACELSFVGDFNSDTAKAVRSHQITFNTKDGVKGPPNGWKEKTKTVDRFLVDEITNVIEQKIKDGRAMTPGSTNNPGYRSEHVQGQNYLLAIDVDNGTPRDELLDIVEKSGLFASVYATYSDGATVSAVKEKALADFCKANGGKLAGEDQPRLLMKQIKAYFTSVKSYRIELVETFADVERVEKTEHTTKQGEPVEKTVIEYAVRHAPIEKTRLVFFLREPFDFNDDRARKIKAWRKLIYWFCQKHGVTFDASGVDPSRVSYLPACPIGETREVFIVAGDFLDVDLDEIEAVDDTVRRDRADVKADETTEDQDLDEPEAGEPDDRPANGSTGSAGKRKTKNLDRFLARLGRKFMAARWARDMVAEGRLELRGSDNGGSKISVACPDETYHTIEHGKPIERDTAFYLADADPVKGEGFKATCLHGGCKVRAGGDGRAYYFDKLCEIAGVEDAQELVAYCFDTAADYSLAGAGPDDPDTGDYTLPLMRPPAEDGERPRPYKTRINFRRAVTQLGVKLRNNVFSDTMLIEGLDGFGPEYEDTAENRLRFLCSERFQFNVAEKEFSNMASDFAHAERFHPVREFLDSAQANWDSTNRLDTFCSRILKAKDGDSELNQWIVKTWLKAGVRRIRKPGCKFDEILILRSPQGGEKSTFFKILAVNEDWYFEGLRLNLSQKELIEVTQGIWIADAAELEGRNKADDAHSKGLLSRNKERARLAYARRQKTVYRSFVIGGSTNEEHILRDPTGNRRYWIIDVNKDGEPIDLDTLKKELFQVWGEAATLEAANPADENIRLPRHLWKEAEAMQARSTVENQFHDALAKALGDLTGEIMVDDVHNVILKTTTRRKLVAGEVNAAMKALGWTYTSARIPRSASTTVKVFSKGNSATWQTNPVLKPERDLSDKLKIAKLTTPEQIETAFAGPTITTETSEMREARARADRAADRAADRRPDPAGEIVDRLRESVGAEPTSVTSRRGRRV